MFEPIDIDGKAFQEKYHVGLLSGKLLAASTLDNGQIQELLNHDTHLTTSKAMCVMKACARILKARESHEKVFISGDYDADGVTSTAIMKATLDALGIVNGYYIPDRFKEGYGLKPEIVDMVQARGYSLIITVDNGVKAHPALKRAKELGIDVIVTDHHIIEEEVESDIVVHPQYMEDAYAYLSGAGVALEISRTLIGNRDDLNALAGVAAIGDVMPLWRETRKLVLCALDQLKQGKPAPLAALLYPGSHIDESVIAFSIVPKLNALSRMSDIANVNTVVPFLLSRNPVQINHYVQQLNQVNDLRKKISQKETEDARTRVNEDAFQIIYNPSYHVGICGLVAGKICEEVHKPVLVLTDYGDAMKGSGRSVKGFDLFSFLSEIDGKKEFGGHEMACGISIYKEKFRQFCADVQTRITASEYVFTEENKPSIFIQPDDINFENILDLDRLSPMPKELPSPVFTIRNFHVLNRVKRGSTVRYEIASSHGSFEACVFHADHAKAPERPQELTGRLTIRKYRGRIQCQMMVDDAK